MLKKPLKIVLIGGPATGKTTVLEALKAENFHCFEEISREVTLKSQKKGIEQLFLSEPLLFSEMLLEGREKQYLEAEKSLNRFVFFDRGIPDVKAYLDYFKLNYPKTFLKKCQFYSYDYIFHFSPWEKIHMNDNERYESFEESIIIDQYIKKTYTDLGYKIINVPFGKLEERCQFILNFLSSNYE
ncbi:AAA family ATPase [Polaribacter sp.]|uniref:AAA family ATPase n=1 Tax=Polaribacter sp. TaxID=1920175 RepID=UPI004047B550